MTTPTEFLGDLVAKLSRGDTRLWRNNVGEGWVGKTIYRDKTTITLQHPRVLHAGLCVGSSDLIGLRTIIITPEMVGQKIAVFAGIEGKLGTGRATRDQRAFIDYVKSAGGLAGTAGSIDEARAILSAPTR